MGEFPEAERNVAQILRREALDPDPVVQFGRWFEVAKNAGIRQPNAMTLATATPDGVPSARMVLLKSFDERGFVFYTNYQSQKGQELAANPRAALVFYWDTLARQVRLTGRVVRTSRAEAAAYFHGRPRGSQLSAVASAQSEVIASRTVLEQRVAELDRLYEGRPVEMPAFWGGFRLIPHTFEFWQSGQNRLHDRFRYRQADDNTWIIERLAP